MHATASVSSAAASQAGVAASVSSAAASQAGVAAALCPVCAWRSAAVEFRRFGGRRGSNYDTAHGNGAVLATTLREGSNCTADPQSSPGMSLKTE